MDDQELIIEEDAFLPSPAEEAEDTQNAEPGTLYIVATPIGNSRDMSIRGRAILYDCDMIAAEDTRRSMVLLNKLGIRNRLVSNHKFNEYGKARFFLQALQEGKSVAVITDESSSKRRHPRCWGTRLLCRRQCAVDLGVRFELVSFLRFLSA